jgi:hypothetical protein
VGLCTREEGCVFCARVCVCRLCVAEESSSGAPVKEVDAREGRGGVQKDPTRHGNCRRYFLELQRNAMCVPAAAVQNSPLPTAAKKEKTKKLLEHSETNY